MDEKTLLMRTGSTLPIINNKNVPLNQDLIKHQIDIENKELEFTHNDKQWRSCCFSLHKESSIYFGKLTISLLGIAICAYQLINNNDNCTAQLGYSSTLSMIIGTWLRI
jgi:hypothetical protein